MVTFASWIGEDDVPPPNTAVEACRSDMSLPLCRMIIHHPEQGIAGVFEAWIFYMHII
jgi:hypothetical protein